MLNLAVETEYDRFKRASRDVTSLVYGLSHPHFPRDPYERAFTLCELTLLARIRDELPFSLNGSSPGEAHQTAVRLLARLERKHIEELKPVFDLRQYRGCEDPLSRHRDLWLRSFAEWQRFSSPIWKVNFSETVADFTPVQSYFVTESEKINRMKMRRLARAMRHERRVVVWNCERRLER